MQEPLLATSFWPPEQLAQTWKDVAEVAILFVATAFGLLQLALLRRQQADTLRQQVDAQREARRRGARELDAQLASDVLTRIKKSVGQAFPDKSYPDGKAVPLAVIQKQVDANSDLAADLDNWLNYWETVSMSVYAGASDEDMTYEFIGGMLVRYGGRFREYIEDSQARFSHKSYCYLQALTVRWAARRKDEVTAKRTPIFLRDPFPQPARSIWLKLLIILNVLVLVAAAAWLGGQLGFLGSLMP